jgi:serine/threonine-protein kinase RsbW
VAETLKDRLVVGNDTRYLILVRDFVARLLKHTPFTESDGHKIILAVDEAVSNVMEHGYAQGQDGTIEIEADSDPRRFRIVIRDQGRIFNPDTVRPPDIREHVRAGKRKGLGIFLMRRIMDEVAYRFKEGVKNELTLVKYIR